MAKDEVAGVKKKVKAPKSDESIEGSDETRETPSDYGEEIIPFSENRGRDHNIFWSDAHLDWIKNNTRKDED